MAERTLQQHAITCSAAISAREELGEWQWQWAPGQDGNRAPDCHGGGHGATGHLRLQRRDQRSWQWRLWMAESTVRQDTITITAAVNACGKAGERQIALGLLAGMAERTPQQEPPPAGPPRGAAAMDVFNVQLGLAWNVICTDCR